MIVGADRRAAAAIGVGAALVSAVVTFHGIGRPAVWTDEAATANAVRRSWGGLAHLLLGRDAPLVPYYVIAKLWYAAAGLVSDADPWTICRWLSALLASVCVGLLAWWIAGTHRPTAVVAAGVLVAVPGFDRFAQEARPYSAMLLVATWSWFEWHRLVTGGGPGRARYASATVALALVNPFALVQTAAQGAAALSLRRRWARPDVRRTYAMAAAGVLIAAPWVVWSATHGRGPSAVHRHVSWDQVEKSFTQMVCGPLTATTWPIMLAVIVGVVTAIGQIVTGARRRDLAVIALVWTAASPLLLPIAGTAVQVALVPRYWLSSLPGVALLIALAATALADGVAVLLARAGPVARVVLPVVFVVGVAVLGVQGQQSIRRSDGHGENSHGALEAVSVSRLRGLPLLFAKGGDALVIGEARPDLQRRIVGWDRSTGRNVSQVAWGQRRTRAALAPSRRALLLLRVNGVFRARRTQTSLRQVLAGDLPDLRARGVDPTDARIVFQGGAWIVVECTLGRIYTPV